MNIASAYGWYAEVLTVGGRSELMPLAYWSQSVNKDDDLEVVGCVAVGPELIEVTLLEAISGERFVGYVFEDDIIEDEVEVERGQPEYGY